MKKYSIIVYRKNSQGAKTEFARYEFNNSDITNEALSEIIQQGCWKNIPQKNGDPPINGWKSALKAFNIARRIYIPFHEISEVEYIEREV